MFESRSALLSKLLAVLVLPALVGCLGMGKKPAPKADAAKTVVVDPVKPAPAPAVPAPKPVAEPAQPPGDDRIGPALPKISELYRIRTDDMLEIGVWGEEDTKRSIRVGPDGRISYMMATELMVAGLTLGELKAAVHDQLKDLYKRPVVYVSLLDSAGLFVTVTGQVGHPGIYKITNETKLIDVVTQAGGIPLGASRYGLGVADTEIADLSRSYLLRGERFEPVDFTKLFGNKEEVDPRELVANNVKLRPNDHVYIASAIKLDNKIYVLGMVGSPGLIQFSKDITFLEAIARSGDIPGTGWERKSFIIRGRLTNPQIIEVNARKIRVGEEKDFYLKAGDVVFVPKTPLTKAAEVLGQMSAVISGMNSADSAYKNEWFKK
jgi:polysaccharide export outer membrane protein